MTNEICVEINPDCLLISCCSEPCELMNKKLSAKLRVIGMKGLYAFYYDHIMNKHTCPRCNREDIQVVKYSSVAVRCTFCNKVFEFHLNHNKVRIIAETYDAFVREINGVYMKWKDLDFTEVA